MAHPHLFSRMIVTWLALAFLIAAPVRVFICGQALSLLRVDPTSLVDPCLDASPAEETASAGVATAISAVALPPAAPTPPPAALFISLLALALLGVWQLAHLPPTPPPRFR